MKMRLTAELVLEKLKEKIEISACGNLSGRPTFGRPLLYEKGKAIRRGHFYAAEADQVEEAFFYGEDICFILRSGIDKARAMDELPYICVETEESLSWVLNEIQEIFDSLEAWKEKLESIRNENGSLEELLQVSYPFFCNPLVVMGTDFTMKAQAGQKDMPAESKIFEPGMVNMEYVNALTQDATYQEMQKARGVFLFPEYITGYRSFNLNLWDKEECRYRLIEVEFQKNLTEGDCCLMEYLAPYVKYCVYRQESVSQGDNNTLRRIFNTILTDRTADYMEISQQLHTFGWNQDAKYLCMVFQITYLDQRNLTANAICGYLEKTYTGTCSFPYGEEIVTFFNLDAAGGDVYELEGRLKYFIRESFLKAGYSWVMTGHGNLRRQYVQACIALDVGSRVKPYLWIHHFNEVAFSYIVEQSARRLPGYMLCHEKLLELQRLDEQQNTEYMKTLKVYLDEHLNAMQSSKKLYIHRSTFLYRLDKIKAVLESDLDDPEEILYLSFSFRLLDKEKIKK